MAHFLTLVLLDPDEPDYVASADARLRRYFSRDLGASEDAKCDGFVIGGRFDGDIWGKEQHHDLTPAQYQARYGLDKIKTEDNVRPVFDLRDALVPFAVVMPDGAWRDAEGKSDEDWEAEWRALRDAHRFHVAVAFDCHC